jgi:catechol 2,3-dioxygenase-like lactoylglutathione lyase family enzyme
MSITRFDHLYLETRHFERSLEFWRALGFEEAQRWGEGEHRACLLRSEGAQVVVAEVPAGAAPQRPTAHFALRQADALAARLAADPRVTVRTPLEPTHWGTRWIRVEDPDGNLYCLEEPADTAAS